ncbi:DNA-3-methyladenine glycosylase 2 family protein [Patescibacteria group bacterium]|nr:MAG: DNA-3-methyladenine glycosylase 2 family protein [Patescibacteria group bacterium]
MNSTNLTTALKYLRKDTRLGDVVKKNPKPDFKPARNVYEALVRSIVYQQLSGKAAGTILRRFLELFPGAGYPKPEAVLKTSVAKMRGVGLSGQKTEYIKDLSKKFLDGTIEPKKFKAMTDEEIRQHLIAVKGIGRWSADMFLMFALNRPDVLPTGDLGIRKGFQKLFKMKELPDSQKMERLAEPWRPYRTVASWYLWRLADEGNRSR